jgi:hypothetical protein
MEAKHGQMEEAMARLAEMQARTEAELQQLARKCETFAFFLWPFCLRRFPCVINEPQA